MRTIRELSGHTFTLNHGDSNRYYFNRYCFFHVSGTKRTYLCKFLNETDLDQVVGNAIRALHADAEFQNTFAETRADLLFPLFH